jgi:N-acetylated-alpha-linked acidic dipeptidase
LEKERALGTTSDGTLGPDHMISFLGSGTDFTAFYQHLGIISANLGFGFPGASSYGVYHSTMDSLMYMEKAGDPHYATHTTTAKWWGLITMRLASDQVLPFDYTTYGLVMREDLAGFEEQTAALGRAVDYEQLHAAIGAFSANAELFQARVVDFAVAASTSSPATAYWNDKLVRLERQLTSEAGLPHRPWFKHLIFGPGFFEGYAGTAFPGLSDAIVFGDDAQTIQKHVDDLTDVVSGAAAFLVAV